MNVPTQGSGRSLVLETLDAKWSELSDADDTAWLNEGPGPISGGPCSPPHDPASQCGLPQLWKTFAFFQHLL